MSRNCNGHIRDSLDLYEPEKATGDSPMENEEVLRGFQKEPVVVCERFNIMPFLTKMESDSPAEAKGPIFVSVHDIGKYSKKCSVRLRRENLEKLKEEFTSNLKRNYVYCTSFTCNICQKVFLSEEKLLNHLESKHVSCYKPENKNRKKVSFSDEIIVHEVKEYHKCRKCPKIYEDYPSLKVHMKEIHKKRKCYICVYCSKDFVDRMFFKVHVKLHCDACGLLLPNKKSYSEHRRNVCKLIKKYVCKTCHISLFYFMDLKDHSYEHLGQFYICDICKDRFDDKCALSHHIKFLHSRRRPKTLYTTRIMGGDNVYVCKFCDLITLEQGSIEKHVSTFPEYEKCAMTGYKDFYFCDQCFEKFSTETDMLQHKWSHFLKSAQQNIEELPKPVNLLNKMQVLTDTQNTQNNDPGESTEILADSTTRITDTQKSFKRIYNLKTDKLPPLLQPRIVLEKLILPRERVLVKLVAEKKDINSTPTDVIDLTGPDTVVPNKPIIEKRRTLLSKHQCQYCLKYLSTKYCLIRHLHDVHGIAPDPKYSIGRGTKGNLRCNDCEEDFALPSLLKNHNCIRIRRPEPPFQDARPDIHLDTSVFSQHNGFDDIEYNNDDYMNSVDFDIPAPIVELTEFENVNLVINDGVTVNNDRPFVGPLNNPTVMNNDRSSNSLAVNNDRLLNSLAVNNDRPFNNLTVNNDRLLNNVVHNDRPLNDLTANNDRQIINMVNNHRQLIGSLNNMNNNYRQLIGPLNNMRVNNDRPLNNLTVNDRQLNNASVTNVGQFNGPLNNVPLNNMDSGKRLRYIYVQEVPIEF